MQVAEYALPSSGNNWYVNLAVNLADSLPSNMKVTFHIYDGESVSEEHLLGEYKTSFALVKKEQTLKAKAQKRPVIRIKYWWWQRQKRVIRHRLNIS